MTTSSVDAEPDALAPVAPPARKSRGRGRFVLVLVLLGAAVGLLLYKGLLSSLDYYETVDYALAHRAQLGTSSFRLEGVVVPGSVEPTARGSDFSISGADCRRVHVAYTGSPPGLFRPGIPVVVVGRFSSVTSLTFLSSQLEVKHSASYVAAHPGRVKVPANSC